MKSVGGGSVRCRDRLVAGLLGSAQRILQVLDARQLTGLFALQLLATLHHLQQRVLQARLPALQRLQFVLQLFELLGPGAGRVQQGAVAVLALAHRVDFGLQFRHLRVDVLERQAHRGEPVVGLALFGSHLVESLFLGQVGDPVLQLRQFGVEFSQLEQRTLLGYFSFHTCLSA